MLTLSGESKLITCIHKESHGGGQQGVTLSEEIREVNVLLDPHL